MSYPHPTTIDTPIKLAILPDWAAGVGQQTTYRTDISRSRAGLEQRAQRRRRPILTMDYQASQSEAGAQRRIEAALVTARTPLLVPWWPNGSVLALPMTSDTSVQLTADPIAEDWPEDLAWVYLWGRAEGGGEWRQFASIAGSVVTLVDTGDHVQFSAGAFIWPARLCVREIENAMLQIPRHRESTDALKFRTL